MKILQLKLFENNPDQSLLFSDRSRSSRFFSLSCSPLLNIQDCLKLKLHFVYFTHVQKYHFVCSREDLVPRVWEFLYERLSMGIPILGVFISELEFFFLQNHHRIDYSRFSKCSNRPQRQHWWVRVSRLTLRIIFWKFSVWNFFKSITLVFRQPTSIWSWSVNSVFQSIMLNPIQYSKLFEIEIAFCLFHSSPKTSFCLRSWGPCWNKFLFLFLPPYLIQLQFFLSFEFCHLPFFFRSHFFLP